MKKRVCQLFPRGHPYREAVMREPDSMTLQEFDAKRDSYIRLAWAMR